jgi:predicted transcriptional regulator
MTNGERFLSAFRSIEALLRERTQADRSATFSALVLRAKAKDPAVRNFAEDLLEFAELRNAIVHRRDDRLLAEPNDEAVLALEAILATLRNPPRVLNALGMRRIVTCSLASTVREAATLMKEGDFSQLPVVEKGEKAIGLLTAETVARWVASELSRNDGILEDATVEVAMSHSEDPDNHAFMARTATVFDAISLFHAYSDRGKTLDAILVTQDGAATKLLNILTIYDVPALLAKIPRAVGGR